MVIRIDASKCMVCGACLETCPVDALKIKDGKISVNEDCIECGICESACLFGVFSLEDVNQEFK